MALTCFFHDCMQLTVSEIGGKGMSLVLMTRNRFPVPPGFVLTSEFFAPWFAALKQSNAWQQFLKTTPAALKADCAALKALCPDLTLEADREKALNEALSRLEKETNSTLFAVRSSSPEEDLEGASFAGGYETLLGVKTENILQAVRQAFASCLDERIFLYKQEQGFAVFEPRIAVIIQVQIPSESAGVAFSLNPLNNCYDEVVVNANFGLGESVVAGQVAPDQYVVDKVSRRVLFVQTGKKESAVWLNKEGGTYQSAPAAGSQCLSESQILEVTDLTARVEAYYAKPVDIEWAFAGGKLFLLQARPVTAYLPLPEEMQTAPGAAKRLYLDMFLAKQGIHEPFSILGLDYLAFMQRSMYQYIIGTDAFLDITAGLYFNSGGRGYMNLSNNLKFQGKKRTFWGIKTQDTLSVDILQSMDLTPYIVRKLPQKLRSKLFTIAFTTLRSVKKAFKAFGHPDAYHAFFKEETKRMLADLEEKYKARSLLKELVVHTADRYGDYLANVSMPVTYAAEVARAKIKSLLCKEDKSVQEQVVYLEQALPNNITIEMGLAMYALAQHQEIRECTSGEVFAARLQAHAFSPSFLSAWDRFMEQYGFRCPKELDAATPRFYERPAEFFNQLAALAKNIDQHNNPQAVYDRGVQTRKQACEQIRIVLRSRGKARERRFLKYYHILETFGAYREIHKYYFIKMEAMIRRRTLEIAETFVKAGRLKSGEEIFDLTVEEITSAETDAALDLGKLSENNTRFLKRLGRVRRFPRIIDSRGKIFYAPPRPVQAGELAGEPISPGKVTGVVKVLSHPDEKPLLPGEILVARATDPGWTPLFLNAGGIILEVGGLLQHGALVAREYCKPCIAGIEQVTSLLKDGQTVEMDGANGIIKLINSQ